MSQRLVERASGFLERRTGRRGFLTRSAMVGTALAVAPTSYVLKPKTAYAAICSCSGQSCACGSRCCDGYTEFCCTITGRNECPPGSLIAGWWKADGSGFCDVPGQARPRYYMDCNTGCGSCGCGAGGVCGPPCAAIGCSCGCANGDCRNRKACCTRFRYGQCNQAVRCVGPIVCRLVTCTPPWMIDPTCTTAVATDNNTRFHDAPCLHPPPLRTTVAVFRNPEWHVRDSLTERGGSQTFAYGQAGDVPLMGDWNGDGIRTPGLRRGNVWYLRNSLSSGPADIVFTWGRPDDIPLVGDWDGNGRDGVGILRGRDWYLKNGLDDGTHHIHFAWGREGDIPVVGDWNGNGRDGVGILRGRDWYLKNTLDSGPHHIHFGWGREGDVPVVGDWDGDGRDGVAIFREGQWFFKNRLDASPHEAETVYGQVPGDVPFATARA
jgi:hypothetical protein